MPSLVLVRIALLCLLSTLVASDVLLRRTPPRGASPEPLLCTDTLKSAALLRKRAVARDDDLALVLGTDGDGRALLSAYNVHQPLRARFCVGFAMARPVALLWDSSAGERHVVHVLLAVPADGSSRADDLARALAQPDVWLPSPWHALTRASSTRCLVLLRVCTSTGSLLRATYIASHDESGAAAPMVLSDANVAAHDGGPLLHFETLGHVVLPEAREPDWRCVGPPPYRVTLLFDANLSRASVCGERICGALPNCNNTAVRGLPARTMGHVRWMSELAIAYLLVVMTAAIFVMVR